VSIEDVNEFNEPVELSILVNRLFCVVLVPLLELVYELKSLLILPDSVSNDPILLFCVLLIVAIEPLKSLILVDIDELVFVIVVFKSDVVVAIEALMEPTLLDIDELKLLIVEVIDELNPLKLSEILELNVEYPVVPVINT
jgi:hypothetical protein